MARSRFTADRPAVRWIRRCAATAGLVVAVASTVPGVSAAPPPAHPVASTSTAVAGAGAAAPGGEATGGEATGREAAWAAGGGSAGPARTADAKDSRSPRVAPGDTVYSSTGITCRAGFNAHAGSTWYLVLPGQCTTSAANWYTSPVFSSATYIGPSAGSPFPGGTYGLVRYDNPAIPHSSPFTQASGGHVGESVCASGTVSGVHCGTILALNATVNTGSGVITGLIVTNICHDPGGDGTVLFDGTTLIGLLLGGSGNCTGGGESYYVPVTTILNAYGLTL